MLRPLKDKTLKFEHDYIETEIKWNLKLGDDIFKKSDVKNAVGFLKTQLNSKKKASKSDKLSYKEVYMVIDSAFPDIAKNKNGRLQKR